MTVVSNESHSPCSHFDHHDESIRGDDYYEIYDRLRDTPVAWSPEHGGFWMVSGYAGARVVLKDHTIFSSAGGCFLPDLGYRNLALEQDPPEHGPFRKLFATMVGRSAVLAHEDAIEEMISRVISAFVAAGSGDARTEICEKIPVESVALMFGLSADTASQVRELTTEAWKRMATDPAAVAPLATLLLLEVAERRRRAQDDFLTELTRAEIDGRPLTDEEIGNVLIGAVIAGHETTMNASTNIILELAQDPELQLRLRNRTELIPNVVDESLRHRAPIHVFFRTVTKDTILEGTPMQAGEKVAVLYASANRDPGRFDEPAVFRPEREDIAHLAFGWGIHRCVGAFLAQTELRLLIEEMLGHGIFRLTGKPVPAALEGGHHMGFAAVPIRYEAP